MKRRNSWSAADLALLRERYPLEPLHVLAQRLGRTEKAVRSMAKRIHVQRGNRRAWTPAEIRTLHRLYADMPTQQLADRLGRPVGQVYQKAISLGLRKTAEYLAGPAACRLRRGDNVGAAYRFRKGLVPFNKGVKGWQAGGRSPETRFKPGRSPSEAHNYKPVGSLRITKDGYLQRKLTDDQSIKPAQRWVAEHALVWQAAHGPIPPGHVVVFRLGKRTTIPEEITTDSVELISRADLARRNSVHNLPADLKHTIRALGTLRRAITIRRRKAA